MNDIEKYVYQLFMKTRDKYGFLDYDETEGFCEYVMSNDEISIIVFLTENYGIGVRVVFAWRKQDNSWIMFEIYDQSVDYVVKWMDEVCQIVKPVLLASRL